MISALGHCEDSECSQSISSPDLVRVFRCSIHCDRLLCLYHLNAHDVYYEQEKKQNDIVLNELRSCLTLYQTIFEQHIQTYRDIVHQATSLLLHNTSSIVPIEKIRPVLEQLQKAIAMFQGDSIIIKTETALNRPEFNVDKEDAIIFKELSKVKEEPGTETTSHNEPGEKVVLRLPRVDLDTKLQGNDAVNNREIDKDQQDSTNRSIAIATAESVKTVENEARPHALRARKLTDDNKKVDSRKKSATLSSNACVEKNNDKRKKRSEKTASLKRLQT